MSIEIIKMTNQKQESLEGMLRGLIIERVSSADEEHISLELAAARSSYSEGNYDKTIETLKDALKLDPENPVIYTDIGVVLLVKKDYEEAVGAFKKAIELGSEDLDLVYDKLGYALDRLGDTDGAINAYSKSLEIAPCGRVYNNLGISLFDQGDVDHAIANFKKAITHNPKQAVAYKNLAYALAVKGEIDEAINAYNKVLEIDPHGSTYLMELLKKAEKKKSGFFGMIYDKLIG